MTTRLSHAVLCIFLMSYGAWAEFTQGRKLEPRPSEFKPGDYVWEPEVSPSGPVVVVVSIPQQSMYVYRNGLCIGRSTISTGTKDHPTPTGVFTILQKKVDHESSIYKGSKMPHMQRLTWDGIAIHAGNLPGYPASHGCIRLPVKFAAELYEVTVNSSTVIVTDGDPESGMSANPGLLFSGKTGQSSSTPMPESGFEWTPEKSLNGPVSIIFSLPDSTAYVYRNGIQIGRTLYDLGLSDEAIKGTYVYSALAGVDNEGRRSWQTTTSMGGGKALDVMTLRDRVTIPDTFLENVRAIIAVGTTLVITDMAVTDQTRREGDFRIMTTDDASDD